MDSSRRTLLASGVLLIALLAVAYAPTLAWLGCAVQRQGVLLAFPNFTLAVADACSGLRSVMMVLAIAALAAHLARVSFSRKVLLVALSSLAALLVNVLRITLVALIGIA